MPWKPKPPCRFPGCVKLAEKRGYCLWHLKEIAAQADKERPTATERGYTWAWHKASRAYLNEHPLCVECEKVGIVKEATVVDHIKPHRGDWELFWDENNWQALCKQHHDIKSAREHSGRGD
jgi:5-methylcytosine-specific restriction protein A